jgi:hypothetical protein
MMIGFVCKFIGKAGEFSTRINIMVVLSIEWPGSKKADPQAGFIENPGIDHATPKIPANRSLRKNAMR